MIESSNIISVNNVNFKKGSAIADGSCFFDSFRQGLKELSEEITIEQLRKVCLDFASKTSVPDWFRKSISQDHDSNAAPLPTTTIDQYKENIMQPATWGCPEREGIILCERYNVKLYMFEKHKGLTELICQAVSAEGSRSVTFNDESVDWNDNMIDIINEGNNHFEPLFDMRSQEKRDYQFANNLQEKDDHKSAMYLQEQEDFKYAKELQITEIKTYIKNIQHVSLLDNLIAKITEVFEQLLQQNKEGDIQDVVNACVKHFEQDSKDSQHKPSCRMEETKLIPHFTPSLTVNCGG